MHVKRKYKLPDYSSFKKLTEGIWEREYYTNHGPLGRKLEHELKDFLGVKHAVCMTNDSIALMISILIMEAEGKAVIPALSHLNIAQSVIWAGMEYEFCDIRPNNPTIGIDELKSAVSDDTGLIIALNPFGHACEIEKLETFAKDRNLKLIFISNRAFGQKYNGKMFGGFGDMEIFSFDQSQLVNTGEGACVTTNNDLIAAKLRNARSSYGAGEKVPIPYTGNGRMSEIQAGMALLSLNEIEKKTNKNKERFNRLNELAVASNMDLLQPDSHCSNLKYSESVFSGTGKIKSLLSKKLQENGIVFNDFKFYGRDTAAGNRTLGLPNFKKFVSNNIAITNNQLASENQFERIQSAFNGKY
jgi:dTDP-4-amino-4,6-dideoxygalactose transaminase